MLSLKITPILAAVATPFASALATPVQREAQYSGDITFYNPSADIGACGTAHGDGEMVAALGHDFFDPQTPGGNPNRNPLCGRRANVHYQGKAVTVTVVDRCQECKMYDIDLSPGAYNQIADPAHGRVQGTWELV